MVYIIYMWDIYGYSSWTRRCAARLQGSAPTHAYSTLLHLLQPTPTPLALEKRKPFHVYHFTVDYTGWSSGMCAMLLSQGYVCYATITVVCVLCYYHSVMSAMLLSLMSAMLQSLLPLIENVSTLFIPPHTSFF
jgi:hypothetical protein